MRRLPGDTLESLAQKVYVSSRSAFLIANANGVTSNAELDELDAVVIPDYISQVDTGTTMIYTNERTGRTWNEQYVSMVSLLEPPRVEEFASQQVPMVAPDGGIRRTTPLTSMDGQESLRSTMLSNKPVSMIATPSVGPSWPSRGIYNDHFDMSSLFSMPVGDFNAFRNSVEQSDWYGASGSSGSTSIVDTVLGFFGFDSTPDSSSLYSDRPPITVSADEIGPLPVPNLGLPDLGMEQNVGSSDAPTLPEPSGGQNNSSGNPVSTGAEVVVPHTVNVPARNNGQSTDRWEWGTAANGTPQVTHIHTRGVDEYVENLQHSVNNFFMGAPNNAASNADATTGVQVAAAVTYLPRAVTSNLINGVLSTIRLVTDSKAIPGLIDAAANPLTSAAAIVNHISNLSTADKIVLATELALPFAHRGLLAAVTKIRNGEMFGKPSVPSGLDLDTIAKIVNTPKAERPHPSEYLNPTYSEQHLAPFKDGVTKIMGSEPNGQLGRDSTFVMPTSVADKVIELSQGDPRKLETLLAVPGGTFGSNPIRVDSTDFTGLRIPSGNEGGANEQWIPGGFTAGGIPEAVVDPLTVGSYTTREVYTRVHENTKLEILGATMLLDRERDEEQRR